MPDPTTRRGLPKPLASESPDGPAQIGALANALDNDVRSFNGTEATRAAFTPPATGFTGTGAGAWKDSERYFATDTGVEWIRSAGGFVALNPKDAAANVPSLRTLGTGAQQAAAGSDTRLTDTRTPSAGSIRQSQYDSGVNGGPAAGAFYVFPGLSSGTAIPRGNPIPMPFERFDVGNNMSGGIFTCPRAGIWRFSWGVRTTTLAGGVAIASMLLLPGTLRVLGSYIPSAHVNASSTGSGVASLAAGDTVSVGLDGGLADLAWSSNGGSDTYFCGEFVGPA